MTAVVRHLSGMVACRWSARRLDRYLDQDPSAPLTAAERQRLERHLAVCERCARAADERRALRRALGRWSRRKPVDPAAVERMRTVLDRITDGGGR